MGKKLKEQIKPKPSHTKSKAKKKKAALKKPAPIRTLSPRTVEYIQAILSRALNQAVNWQILPRNVASIVRRPKTETKAVQFLTIVRRLHALLKEAELPPMRFHDLRHTCASLLLAER